MYTKVYQDIKEKLFLYRLYRKLSILVYLVYIKGEDYGTIKISL